MQDMEKLFVLKRVLKLYSNELKRKDDTAPMASSTVMFEGSIVLHSLCIQYLCYLSSHVEKIGSIARIDDWPCIP